jgi:DNA repair exonuclease SbcCD ATPase subunit
MALESRIDRLEEALSRLAEAQARTEVAVKDLAQAQVRTEERIERLAEAQARTEAMVQTLAQQAGELNLRVGELARQVGRLANIIGCTLEDLAREVTPAYLAQHYGMHVPQLDRHFIELDGQELELDLYGEGRRNGEAVIVVGGGPQPYLWA